MTDFDDKVKLINDRILSDALARAMDRVTPLLDAGVVKWSDSRANPIKVRELLERLCREASETARASRHSASVSSGGFIVNAFNSTNTTIAYDIGYSLGSGFALRPEKVRPKKSVKQA